MSLQSPGTLLEIVGKFWNELVITGHFNIHGNDTTDWRSRRLAEIVKSFNLLEVVYLFQKQDWRSMSSPCWWQPPPPLPPGNILIIQFTDFREYSMEEVRHVLAQSPPKICVLYLIPADVLLEFIDITLSYIMNMCTASLREGSLLVNQKAAIIMPIF